MVFKRLFGNNSQPNDRKKNYQTSEKKEPLALPSLTDSDLELLFRELLEGTRQAKGQVWAQKWLKNIEHRVTNRDWVEWLQRFEEKLQIVKTPNYELATLMVQFGDLGCGVVGEAALEAGMRLMHWYQGEPVGSLELDDEEFSDLDNLEEEINTVDDIEGSTSASSTPELDKLIKLLESETVTSFPQLPPGLQPNSPTIFIPKLVNQSHQNLQLEPEEPIDTEESELIDLENVEENLKPTRDQTYIVIDSDNPRSEFILELYPSQKFDSLEDEYLSTVGAFTGVRRPTILNTQEPIDSVSHCLFTIEFYRQLLNTEKPAIALKNTQLWLQNVKYYELVEWYRARAKEVASLNPSCAEDLEYQATFIQINPSKINSEKPPFAHPNYWAAYTITDNLDLS